MNVLGYLMKVDVWLRFEGTKKTSFVDEVSKHEFDELHSGLKAEGQGGDLATMNMAERDDASRAIGGAKRLSLCHASLD